VTAGIVVLNSGAVALAVDSVSTIPHKSGIKHYRAATKVLGLHSKAPVGVMWYGDSDYAGMPWEVIVKDFRRSHRDRHNTLREYAEAFFKYLDQESPVWVPDPAEDPPASVLVQRLLVKVHDAIAAANSHRAKGADEASHASKITAAVKTIVNDWLLRLLPATNVLDGSVVDDYLPLWDWFDREVDELGPLTEEARRTLRDATRHAWSHLFDKQAEHTGLVFAGFGDEQKMPGVILYLVGRPLGEHVRRVSGEPEEVSPSQPALIIPLAQDDQTRLFMEGVHPTVKDFFIGNIKGLQREAKLEEAAAKRLLRRLDDHINAHGQSVVDAVRFLPKPELAEFARALISFTGFRLRMSLSDESVGEPIDVAVISRGEGLVWVHRSHYFPPELNPHFIHRRR
jgi:hypothetical protein